MRYIIIEDEKMAANRLREMVSKIRPEYQCVLTLDSVEAAVISLPVLKVDLIFMDIQLSDGNSFDIFDQINIEHPIVFTTAYDEFALKAFKANSIDYLLKPIEPSGLTNAIEKFEKHSGKPSPEVFGLVKSMSPQGKERFVVKVGEHLKTIKTIDIQMIYSQDKGTYLFTKDNRRYVVDYTLDKVEELVNADTFFRISRKYIVNMEYIKDIIAFTNSRLEIMIEGFDEEQVIVARERVSEFKEWLDR